MDQPLWAVKSQLRSYRLACFPLGNDIFFSRRGDGALALFLTGMPAIVWICLGFSAIAGWSRKQPALDRSGDGPREYVT
jgi:hypothetical protein